MRPASNVGSPRLATHSSRANPTFDGQLENTASQTDIVSSPPVVPPKNLRIRFTASSPCVMNTPCRVTSAHAPSPTIVNRAANSTRVLLACVVARTAMASVVRTGVVRAAQGACVGARTTRVAATAGQRRGMAGGVEFARSKVKKDFFVEVRGWPRVVCVPRAGVLVAMLCVCVATVLVWFVCVAPSTCSVAERDVVMWWLTLGCPVQQYNDLRENKFKTWKFNGKTWFPITLMCAILPIGFYKVTKAELVRVLGDTPC